MIKKADFFKQFVGEEMDMIDLDNLMVENGYYSIMDDGVIEQTKRDGNAIYISDDEEDLHHQIIVYFEITIEGGEDEGVDVFSLKITNVEDF